MGGARVTKPVRVVGSDPVFREQSTGPRWMVVVGIVTLVLLIFVMWLAIPELVPAPEKLNAGVVALLLVSIGMVVIGMVLLIMRRSTVVITETHVDAYLDPFRIMHISGDAIEGVEIVDVDFSDARGWGWRLAGTEQYLLWSAGPAVRLTLTKGRSRVLRSDRAAEMAAAVRHLATDPHPR